jgi:hypothetical protein
MSMLQHPWVAVLRPYKAEGTKMRKVTFATIATTGLAAATLGLASPALAAPTDVGSAQDTINSLKAEGYTVIVHKVGNAPLSQCTVSATKAGHSYTGPGSGPGRQGRYTETVVAKTVDVYVSC